MFSLLRPSECEQHTAHTAQTDRHGLVDSVFHADQLCIYTCDDQQSVNNTHPIVARTDRYGLVDSVFHVDLYTL